MSPSESASSPTLISRLSVENAAWQALLNVMTEEERALINGEADHLEKLNTSKLAQLNTLSNLARARHDALLAAGLSADHAGMDAWLAQHGQPEHLASWQHLVDLEHEAQALNQRIGTLIDLRLNSTRQALNVLVQAATSKKGGLYDQGGMSTASRSTKPITSA